MNSEHVELTIERLGIHGEGVARLEGLTVFVDGALPQERVRAQIYERKKTYARAHPLVWLEHSSDRTLPPCPLFGQCGGCQLMHLSYPQQLQAKRMRVQDALERIAKLRIEVQPCIPSPQPLGYRNKIQLPMSETLRLGLYARNTHDLIPIDSCHIHCPLGEKIFTHLQRLLKRSSGAKRIKHVLIKTATSTHQVLVVLVTKDTEPLTTLAQQLIQLAPEVKGVVQNINPAENNTILSAHFKTLAGQGWIEEKLCGLCFKVSPASFFQVNPAQAEALYKKVIDLAQFSPTHTVLDAYCGVGTLALISAASVKKVIGIESVPQAILDAKENALRNGITNAQFICGMAEEKIASLEQLDVAILNPPRKGCERALLDTLIAQKVPRVIYVSCDPATLARDVEILTRVGYQLHVAQPFDMFPQTMHVECVVSLSL